MLVTPASDRRNLLVASGLGVSVAVIAIVASVAVDPAWAAGLVVAAGVFWWWRRGVVRRRRVIAEPFPETYRAILQTDVTFYRRLDADRKTRFENMVKVFLDEVTITGIDTTVDDQTRVLVAASAIIPIFGFADFEYSRLGEVLIYPSTFNDKYDAAEATDRNILGMVGDYHLSGVMILSKPSLIAGFADDKDKRNVGIHEFAHLVDKQGGSIDGVPPTTPAATIDPWIAWVGKELRRDGSFADINDYAYTNEAEYFAVLSEYFFENPEQLQQRHPKLYKMMRRMYHQDTKSLLSGRRKRGRKLRRNDPCPCGSGEKYKACCRLKRLNT